MFALALVRTQADPSIVYVVSISNTLWLLNMCFSDHRNCRCCWDGQDLQLWGPTHQQGRKTALWWRYARLPAWICFKHSIHQQRVLTMEGCYAEQSTLLKQLFLWHRAFTDTSNNRPSRDEAKRHSAIPKFAVFKRRDWSCMLEGSQTNQS